MFRDEQIKGIYFNVLDEHPVQDIWKVSPRSQNPGPQAELPLFGELLRTSFLVP
jgi:hypothetical protein